MDGSIYLSIHLSTYLSFFLCFFLSFYLSIFLFLFISLSICKAILRDFLNFRTWNHQKRSNSARLPQLLNLTTSKTKQFCETSSIFEVANIKNKQFCQTLDSIRPSSIMESWVQSWRHFQSMCLKYCSCHEKLRPDHTKCCTCHAKLLANLKIRNPAQEICTLIS